MTYTISNLSDAIAREMHGQETDRIQSLYETAYDAALILMGELDLKETQRKVQISPQVFDDVNIYSCPTDYRSPIDIYPTSGRVLGSENQEDFRRTSQHEFSMRKNNEAPLLSEKWLNGTRFLLLQKYPSTGKKIQLENFDSLTGFTEGGDISNLVINSLEYYEGYGSLSFDLSGSTGAGTLEKTISSQDLTNYRLLGSCFIKVVIPSGYSSRFTSFTIKHGNDSSNYWSGTVTTQHDGTVFQDGMNLLRFDWNSATETGTVDETVMDYMKIEVNYTAGTEIPKVLFDDFNIQLGTMYDLEYCSNYLFRTSAGVWIEKPTSDDDIINLSQESYRIFVDIASMLALGEISSMEAEYKRITERLGYPVDPNNIFKGSIGNYKKQNPSQKPVQTSIIYDYDV